jgi:hypothetical protein
MVSFLGLYIGLVFLIIFGLAPKDTIHLSYSINKVKYKIETITILTPIAIYMILQYKFGTFEGFTGGLIAFMADLSIHHFYKTTEQEDFLAEVGMQGIIQSFAFDMDRRFGHGVGRFEYKGNVFFVHVEGNEYFSAEQDCEISQVLSDNRVAIKSLRLGQIFEKYFPEEIKEE